MRAALITLVTAAVAAGCVAADGNSRKTQPDRPGLHDRDGQDHRRMVLTQMEQGSLSEAHASWAQARNAYTTQSLADPDDVNALIARARTFHAEGRPRQAADMLEQEVRRRETPTVELLLATGDAVLATDRPGHAIDYYQEARSLDGRNKRARYSLFAAYILADRPEDAALLVKSVPPSELPRHLVLLAGRAALLADDAAYAATAFATYLTERPEATDAWVDLARARFRLEQLPAARVAILRALQLEPEHAAAIVLLGHLDYLDGDLDGSLVSYERAVALGAPTGDLTQLVNRIKQQLRERAARQAEDARRAAASPTTPATGASGSPDGSPDGSPSAPAAETTEAAAAAPRRPIQLFVPPPAWSPHAWVGTARPRAID